MSNGNSVSEAARVEVLKMAVELVRPAANEKPESLQRSAAIRKLGYQGDEKKVTTLDLVEHAYNQLLEVMTP